MVNVRFSNRPFGVKRFQTIHRYTVDVAHGLVLLFGIGTKASMGFEDEVEQSKWRPSRELIGRSKRANDHGLLQQNLPLADMAVRPRGIHYVPAGHRSRYVRAAGLPGVMGVATIMGGVCSCSAQDKS